jgi:tRNA A-37 threonylcarbamoyl transferase component Bud32
VFLGEASATGVGCSELHPVATGGYAMVNRVQVGQQLGNYRLVQRLGEGGFAEVYLGEHRYLKRRVAIKVLLLSLTGDDKASERFRQEAQTMASLKHPHIVGCLDFGIDQHIPYIVMDYAPGGTLRDRHPEGSLVSLSTAVLYVEQVADALQYAHDQGVIHLDIKPENMLLGQNDEVLLSDFGLARFTQSLSARVTSLVGTISYMAPEYIQRQPQAASDQYSLALVAYEWLTGIRPFDGDDARVIAGQHLQTQPPSLRAVVPTLPAAVDSVVCAALAKKPEERYPRMIEFAEALSLASRASSRIAVSTLVPEKLETLYREGLKAKGQGKLELAKQHLEELQARAPSFRPDVVQEQLQQLDTALSPQLIARYRAEGEAANQEGRWDHEIDAWNALLQIGPPRADAQEARTRIRLARQHQLNDHLYQDAAQLVAESNPAAATPLLQQLYEQDPYYGDPLGLAKQVKRVRVPRTYQQEQAQREKEEARQDRRDEAEARKADRRDFVEEAYGKPWGKPWLVWLSWFVAVWSVGAMVGAVTQSWLWTLIALVLAAAGSWGLGYRKALAALPLAIAFTVSVALALFLTVSLAHLGYAQPLVSPYTDTIATGLFSSKEVTAYHVLFLGRQLDFGLIGGGVLALTGVVVAFFLRPPYSKHNEERPTPVYYGLSQASFSHPSPEPKKSLYLSVTNLIVVALSVGSISFGCWAFIAFIAQTSNWGFGFDLGMPMAWLGLGIGCVLGIGVGVSIPIWWTAIKQWVQGRR